MKRNILIMSCLLVTLSCSTNPATGKKSLLLTSSATENQQGEEAYKEILTKEKVVTGTAQSRMVEEIGKRIAAVANQPDFQWEFKTLQSDEPNAFCLPGGKVAVYTGIFKYAKNEAGLATIMGHEIAHALARHGGQRMSQQMAVAGAVGLATVALTNMEPTKKQIAIAALGAGATYGIILPYSRNHETEADELGLKLMAKAGYDPSEAVNFWDRFSQAGGGKAPPEFLSTHPNSEKRRDHLRELQPKVQADYQASSKIGLGRNL